MPFKYFCSINFWHCWMMIMVWQFKMQKKEHSEATRHRVVNSRKNRLEKRKTRQLKNRNYSLNCKKWRKCKIHIQLRQTMIFWYVCINSINYLLLTQSHPAIWPFHTHLRCAKRIRFINVWPNLWHFIFDAHLYLYRMFRDFVFSWYDIKNYYKWPM